MGDNRISMDATVATVTRAFRCSRAFRARFVLMALGHYGYGDHVTDERAFSMRLEKVLSRREALVIREDSPAFLAADADAVLIKHGVYSYLDVL